MGVERGGGQGRRHRFLSGGSNRRQGGQATPKYPKNRKNAGFWPLVLESGGGIDLPGFQKFGGQDPVGDAPGGTRLPAVKSWKGTSPKIPRMKWPKCVVFSDF